MKYIHKFDSEMDFYDQQGSVFESPSGYTEPWVSLTTDALYEKSFVSYNKEDVKNICDIPADGDITSWGDTFEIGTIMTFVI